MHQLVVDSSSWHDHQSPALRLQMRSTPLCIQALFRWNKRWGWEWGWGGICVWFVYSIYTCIYLLICTLYIIHMTSLHTKSKYAFHAWICTLAHIIHRPHEPSAEVHISKSAQLLLAIQFSTLLLPWLWLSFWLSLCLLYACFSCFRFLWLLLGVVATTAVLIAATVASAGAGGDGSLFHPKTRPHVSFHQSYLAVT